MSEYDDMSFVPRSLRQTAIGKRYVSACVGSQIRALETKLTYRRLRLGMISQTLAAQQIEFCRSWYMKHANEASVALDELAKTYHWPPESAADETYVWQPPSRP